MLRDLTKSALSLSWALSLLGIKQAVNLVQPRQQPGGNVFGPLAQHAADQLDESMKDVYRSGDVVQGRVVDFVFAVLDPQSWTKVASRVGVTIPSFPGNPGSASSSSGWGNMVNLMNPLNWMNPMNIARGMQNCAPCGGQAAQAGQQPSGAAGDAGIPR